MAGKLLRCACVMDCLYKRRKFLIIIGWIRIFPHSVESYSTRIWSMTNGSRSGIVNKNQRVKEDGGDQLFVNKSVIHSSFGQQWHTFDGLTFFPLRVRKWIIFIYLSHLGFTISLKQYISYFLFSLEDRSKCKSTTDSTTSNIWQTDDNTLLEFWSNLSSNKFLKVRMSLDF